MRIHFRMVRFNLALLIAIFLLTSCRPTMIGEPRPGYDMKIPYAAASRMIGLEKADVSILHDARHTEETLLVSVFNDGRFGNNSVNLSLFGCHDSVSGIFQEGFSAASPVLSIPLNSPTGLFIIIFVDPRMVKPGKYLCDLRASDNQGHFVSQALIIQVGQPVQLDAQHPINLAPSYAVISHGASTDLFSQKMMVTVFNDGKFADSMVTISKSVCYDMSTSFNQNEFSMVEVKKTIPVNGQSDFDTELTFNMSKVNPGIYQCSVYASAKVPGREYDSMVESVLKIEIT